MPLLTNLRNQIVGYSFVIIIIIIIIQEKINVAFSPKWTSRTRYNVKKLT